MQEYCIKTSSKVCFGYLLELPHWGNSNKYPKTYVPSRTHAYIILTPLYSKTGVYRGIRYFSYFAKNIDCGYLLEPPHRGGSNESPQSMVWEEIWKYLNFSSESCPLLVVKFSIYLNRRVFVMYEEKRIKQGLSYTSFRPVRTFLQEQIHYNGNIFGNKRLSL